MANAPSVFQEEVLDGIKSSLSARLILVGGAAADADPTDMHLALIIIGNPPAKAMIPGTNASPGTIPPLRSLP